MNRGNKSSYPSLEVFLLFSTMAIVRLLPITILAVRGELPNVFYKDHYIYLWSAENILKSGTNPFDFFPPLNSLFIAGILYSTGGSTIAALCGMAMVGWLTVVLTYCLANKLFGQKIALWATIICGFYPNFIAYGATFCSETLGTFWVCLAFMILVHYRLTEKLRYLFLDGIVWGIAAQTRGGLHYYAPFLLFGLLLVRFKNNKIFFIKESLTFLGALGIALYTITLVTAPLQTSDAMNPKSGIGSVVHGANRVTTSCADYGDIRGNIFYYINDAREPWPEGTQLFSEELMSLPTTHILLKTAQFILEKPLLYLKNSFLKLSCFWAPNQLAIADVKLKFQRYTVLATLIACCIATAYIIVIISGLCGLWLSKDVMKPFFILFIIFYCLLIFFTVGNSKLRLPLMPFFIIYGSFFIREVFKKRISVSSLARTRFLLLGIILFCANSIYKFPEFLPSPQEIYVRQIELCNQLGFHKTAGILIERYKNMPYYNENQKKRLQTEYGRVKKIIVEDKKL